MEPLLGKTLDELKAVAEQAGLRPFAAGQMARWLYQKGATDIDQMTDLAKPAREWLKRNYVVGREAPKAEARSADGTAKYLFAGAGGRDVESVYIPDEAHDRATLCVSSQAGCRMACRFCMTGRQGFHGNLTAAAIVNQILSVPEAGKLTNVVFMGMGEPLDNAAEVMKVVEIMTAKWGMAWSPKRVTVSTVGANMEALRELVDKTRVHVAVSVHNAVASQRAATMPAERMTPMARVMELLRGHDWRGQRRLSAEYIMWRGVNDDLAHADALARLLEGTGARVNLIRYHAIPGFDGQAPEQHVMEAFRDRLNHLGVTATIRASRGEDIDAACGMLAGRKREKES